MAATGPTAPSFGSADHLPESLRALFWDTDFDSVYWTEHRDYVIRRVLSAGTLESIRWLRRQINDDELRQWIIQHNGRSLSSRQLRFWQVILDLPGEMVDQWLADEGRKMWEGRGRG